jgi:hypothetical protein
MLNTTSGVNCSQRGVGVIYPIIYALTAQVQSPIGITILGKRHGGMKFRVGNESTRIQALQEKFCKAEED